jgi:hypothetical protein
MLLPPDSSAEAVIDVDHLSYGPATPIVSSGDIAVLSTIRSSRSLSFLTDSGRSTRRACATPR